MWIVVFFIILTFISAVAFLRRKIYLQIDFNYDSEKSIYELELKIILWFITIGRIIVDGENKLNINRQKNRSIDRKTRNKDDDNKKKDSESIYEKIAQGIDKVIFYVANIKEIYSSVIRINGARFCVELGETDVSKIARYQGILYIIESYVHLFFYSLFDIDKFETSFSTKTCTKPFQKIAITGIINVKFTHTILEIVKMEIRSKLKKKDTKQQA